MMQKNLEFVGITNSKICEHPNLEAFSNGRRLLSKTAVAEDDSHHRSYMAMIKYKCITVKKLMLRTQREREIESLRESYCIEMRLNDTQ